jgi:hypothetical protein
MTRQRARARARTRAARARVAALIARHEEKKFETCRSFVRSLASGPARACDAAFRGADGRLPSLERSIYMSSRRSREVLRVSENIRRMYSENDGDRAKKNNIRCRIP